jgi:hypothetical protein
MSPSQLGDVKAPSALQRVIVVIASAAITFVVYHFAELAFDDIRFVPYAGAFLMAFVIARFVVYRDPRDTILIAVATMTFAIYIKPLFDPDFNFIRTHFFYHENVVTAANDALIGFATMILGYTLAKRLKPRPLLRNIGRAPVRPRTLVVVSLALMIASIAAIIFRDAIAELSAVFGRLLFLLDQLPLLAIGVGFLAIMEGYRGRAFRVLLFGVFIPLEVFVIVARTLFYHLLVLAGPLTLMFMLRRRRIPIVPLSLGALLLFPAFQARISARRFGGFADEMSLPQLVTTGYSYIVASWSERESRITQVEKDAANARTNSLSLLAHVIRAHETEGKPYKYGSTFWWLPLTPIPRIILPIKPRNDHGTTFPEEYGMKKPGENYALVLPLMVESYINGGLTGVIVLNFLIGVAFCVMCAVFEYGAGVMNMLGLLSVVALSIYVENNITLLFGAALQAMLLWLVLDRLFARRNATLAPPSAPSVVDPFNALPGNLAS